MKPIAAFILLPALAAAQLVVPLLNTPEDLKRPVAMPEAAYQPAVPLTDILATNRALTSFSSFARMHESTADRLGDMHTNSTVLAPLNSAIEALPHKPWEVQGDYTALGADAYSGDDGRDRANQNLLRFVEAHLVTVSPWDKDVKAKTKSGREVWWTEKEGKRVVMPDKVEVDRIASKVGNGELWILKGVLNYE